MLDTQNHEKSENLITEDERSFSEAESTDNNILQREITLHKNKLKEKEMQENKLYLEYSWKNLTITAKIKNNKKTEIEQYLVRSGIEVAHVILLRFFFFIFSFYNVFINNCFPIYLFYQNKFSLFNLVLFFL